MASKQDLNEILGSQTETLLAKIQSNISKVRGEIIDYVLKENENLNQQLVSLERKVENLQSSIEVNHQYQWKSNKLFSDMPDCVDNGRLKMEDRSFDNVDSVMDNIMSMVKEMEDNQRKTKIGVENTDKHSDGNNGSMASLSAPSIHSLFSEESDALSNSSINMEKNKHEDNQSDIGSNSVNSSAKFTAYQRQRLVVSAGNSPILSRSIKARRESGEEVANIKLSKPDLVTFDVEISCPDGQLFKCTAFKVWTAAQLSWKIALMKRMSEKLYLVIQESISELHLIRAIEDHEVIYDIIQSWAPNSSNKLKMIEYGSKFDFFNNPADFLPIQMLDVSYGNKLVNGTDYVQRYLFNFIVKVDAVIDIHHWVFVKDFHKKTWKRMFLRIKNAVLCLCENEQDTGEDTQVYSCKDSYFYFCLEEFINAHKPPHIHCFCIIPTLVSKWKQIKCVSVESRQLYVGWMTAFRLAKHGHQLFKNFCEVIAKEESSNITNLRYNMLSKLKSLNDDIPLDENRAAVDFSGNSSRVISDPMEALQIQHQIGFQIPRPIKRRSKSFSPVTFRRVILSEKVWYHGKLQREDAILKLKKNGMEDGMFLVRESYSSRANLVLSVVKKGKIYHHQIFQEKSHTGKPLYGMDHGPQFASLEQFIEYYSTNLVDGTEVLLKEPCPSRENQ